MPTTPKPRIALKADVYYRAARLAGLETGQQRADAFGISRGNLSRIENGHLAASNDVMARICSALNLGISELFALEVPAKESSAA